MRGINKPVETGTRAINIEQLKRSEWFTGLTWLKQQESKWPNLSNLIYASVEDNSPSSVLMTHAEHKKSCYSVETGTIQLL